MLVLLEWSAAFITWFLVRTQPYWRRIEPFVRLVFLVVVSLIVTFWLAVFTYLTVYYFYLPAVEIILPLHFKFDSQCKLGGANSGVACSFPAENVSLVRSRGDQVFALGQSYKVFIELQVPESQVNVNIGMFMVSSDFYSKGGEIMRSASRHTILQYKSPLLTTLDTVFFAPFYLLGSKLQKQTLRVEMFEHFYDDPYHQVQGCVVQLHSPLIQLYSGQLQVYAQFTGLRWFMFYHPLLSAFLGVTAVFLSLNFLILITLIRRQWIRMEAASATNDQPWFLGKDGEDSDEEERGGEDDWLNDGGGQPRAGTVRRREVKEDDDDDDDDDEGMPDPPPFIPGGRPPITTIGARQRKLPDEEEPQQPQHVL